MANFLDDDQEYQRVDYRLLQNGAVTLYWRPAYLDQDLAWLAAHGVLVQSDDPQLQIEPLGAVAANWNDRESLKKHRDPNGDLRDSAQSS